MSLVKSCIVVPPSDFLESDKVFPPLGPYYIKRYVEENSDFVVDIKYDMNDIEKYDVVGFSVTTPQFNNIDLSKVSKNAIKVIGGAHCQYYEVEKGLFDFVIKGDGCKPFLNILKGEKVIPANDDPDQLPYRDKTFFDFKYYLDGKRATTIMCSRGCPFSCSFCEHRRTPVRFKSPAAVSKEIKECLDLGFEAIMFFDDLFCISLKRVKELCDVIKPFNIKFRCFAHARNFTREMAAILAEAGCVEIGYGAEHVSQKILDLINKKTTTEQNYDIIKIAHEFGIRVKAFLMIGLPGEDRETVKQLEEFVLTSGVDDYDICIYQPFEGTEIVNNPEKFGIKILKEYATGYYKGKKCASECAVETDGITREEIIMWQKRIYSHKDKGLKS